MHTPSFKEDHISQIPALELLIKLGYQYIPQEEAMAMRGSTDNVLLDNVLVDQLSKLNRVEYMGHSQPFDQGTILRAVDMLKEFPLVEGLITTNEKIYDLLTLGTSFEQYVKGDKKSFSFNYIDWENPGNNVFHVTEEYEVSQPGAYTHLRPDIVAFINGIPVVIIECKRPDIKEGKEGAVKQAVSQHIRNQKPDGIPDLYKYSQLLFALSASHGKYATTGIPERFWSVWKEKENVEDEIDRIKNTTLPEAWKNKLFFSRYRYMGDYFEQLESHHVSVTDQDRLLYNLCRPERLLELTYRFLVYDAGEKKIARYQQFFAVKKTLSRIRHLDRGRRQGGVIWHTQGSGKSLTMVMMAKSIALEKSITDHKIVLVTDRIDLDDQLFRTFHHCGMKNELEQAQSGRHLVELIREPRATIITTLLFKFQSALKRTELIDESPNIFVLVDESHRSQYGESHRKMREVFPNACYIGFTGTPLMKKEKSTAIKFGGMIDTYTIDEAVADKAVVPLLYEGKEALQIVNKNPIDRYFSYITEGFTDSQVNDLKAKYSSSEHLNEAEQKIVAIAWDIVRHWIANWKGTGFKGQLTTPSKDAAIKYKKVFDDIGKVTTEVLISPPDQREGHGDVHEDDENNPVVKFWKTMMRRFGNDEKYNKQIIDSFKKREDPEIIIVVDKLLTGFDAPRNVVLYIARSLKEHTLLQAIARVNRLYEGKDFGYIIDYYGILENLDDAITTYSSLEEFDEDDLKGTLISIREQIEKLPQYHTQLWDLFRKVENRLDTEQYEQLLSDGELREEFYDRLSLFARTLKTALSSDLFYEKTDDKTIERYKDDARFFLKLRASVKNRYSESIDYKQYEPQIQKLIDQHVSTDEVIQITKQVNIFEKEKFSEEVEKIQSTSKRADTIASRTAKHINEKMQEDPAFYRKFSQMLQDTIDEYHQKRMNEALLLEDMEKIDEEFLGKFRDIMESVVNHTDETVPESLRSKDIARAFYGVALETLKEHDGMEDPEKACEEIALGIDEIIRDNLVVDWHKKHDIQNRMRQQIDDFIYDQGYEIPYEITDEIIEKTIEIAKVRYQQDR